MSALSIVLILLALLFSSLVLPNDAQAGKRFSIKQTSNYSANIPYFPKCPNPGGTLVASYAEGWHWIVGESSLRWGSDTVSHIGKGNYVQCYCPLNESTTGIQTNWLKVSNITSEQKDLLLSRNWILVQNAADFGLPSEPYVAKNSSFSCKESDGHSQIFQSNKVTIKNSVKTWSNTGNNNANHFYEKYSKWLR